MKNIMALTFRQKQEVLEQIFREYRRDKFNLKRLENKNFYPELNYGIVREGKQGYQSGKSKIEHYVEKKEEVENKIDMFEEIVALLSEENQKIIIHEFMNQAPNNWWMDYYSRSTYYRMKSRAMEELLFYLNL